MQTTKRRNPAVLAVLILAAGCATPQLQNVTFPLCDEQQVNKLSWSVAYMRAAGRSSAFRRCLKGAVEGSFGPGTSIWGGGQYIHTYQETNRIGPYRACDVDSGQFREPSFVYQATPFEYQNRLLAFEAALAVAQSTDPLEIRCTGESGYPAQIQPGSDHGYFRLQHDDPYFFTNRLDVGQRMFVQFPDHQEEHYGEPDRFGTVMPSYPIDEIAGILLHEILHTYGFAHGTEANECGYPGGYDVGRFGSLNEIVEACMSEVVEASVALCTDACDDTNSVAIVTNPIAVTDISHGYRCQCTPFQ